MRSDIQIWCISDKPFLDIGHKKLRKIFQFMAADDDGGNGVRGLSHKTHSQAPLIGLCVNNDEKQDGA